MSQQNGPHPSKPRLPGLGIRVARDGPQGPASELNSTNVMELTEDAVLNNPMANIDLSALAGVSPEQLVNILRLFQSGLLQLPPTTSALPVSAVVSSGDIQALPNNTEIPNDELSEQEDGEVDEEESKEQKDMQEVTLPKNMSAAVPSLSVAGLKPSIPSRTTEAAHMPLASQQNQVAEYAAKSAQAGAFLLYLQNHGVAFDSISKHVSDTEGLRRLCDRLNLFTQQHDISGDLVAQQTGASHDKTCHSLSKSPAAIAQAASSKIGVDNATNRVDRSAYLAKLAAAKAKKAPVARTASVSGEVAPDGAATLAASEDQLPAATNKTVSKSVVKTDLVRQRLEALRAARAVKQNGTIQAGGQGSSSAGLIAAQHTSHGREQNPTPAAPSIQNTKADQIMSAFSQSVNDEIIEHHPALPLATSMVLPVFNSPKAGRTTNSLPGLFLQPIHEHVTAKGSASTDTMSNQKLKRTVPDDDGIMTDMSQKRLFGQSRDHSENEQLIISVSDEEDDELDIRDHVITDDSISESVSLPVISHAVDSISEYERKMEEIARFRQRIAEREKRVKLNSRTNSAQGVPQIQKGVTQVPRVDGISTRTNSNALDMKVQSGTGHPALSSPSPVVGQETSAVQIAANGVETTHQSPNENEAEEVVVKSMQTEPSNSHDEIVDTISPTSEPDLTKPIIGALPGQQDQVRIAPDVGDMLSSDEMDTASENDLDDKSSVQDESSEEGEITDSDDDSDDDSISSSDDDDMSHESEDEREYEGSMNGNKNDMPVESNHEADQGKVASLPRDQASSLAALPVVVPPPTVASVQTQSDALINSHSADRSNQKADRVCRPNLIS